MATGHLARCLDESRASPEYRMSAVIFPLQFLTVTFACGLRYVMG
jgi:hypothetical protein